MSGIGVNGRIQVFRPNGTFVKEVFIAKSTRASGSDTTETWEGKRVQKFVNKGLAPVTSLHQGTVWPRTP